MRINSLFHITFICGVLQLLSPPCLAHSTSQTTVVKHTTSVDPAADGFWKRNVSWKSRWVKYWRPKAIYVPVWKKVWTPVVHTEWVPLPKAPPGWKPRKGTGLSSADGSSSSGGKSFRQAKASNDWTESAGGSSSSRGTFRTHVKEVHF